eukprot:2263614-Pleurochrysis_carterae.AAC.5
MDSSQHREGVRREHQITYSLLCSLFPISFYSLLLFDQMMHPRDDACRCLKDSAWENAYVVCQVLASPNDMYEYTRNNTYTTHSVVLVVVRSPLVVDRS